MGLGGGRYTGGLCANHLVIQPLDSYKTTNSRVIQLSIGLKNHFFLYTESGRKQQC